MRKHILEEAINVTTGDRQNTYGSPKDTFDAIARFWSDYLRIPLSGEDVCHLMTLLKIARTQTGNGYHEDSYVDACGYEAIAAELAGIE